MKKRIGVCALLLRAFSLSCELVIVGEYRQKPWCLAVSADQMRVPLILKEHELGWHVRDDLVMEPPIIHFPVDVSSAAVSGALKLMATCSCMGVSSSGVITSDDEEFLGYVLRKRAKTLPQLVNLFVASEILEDGQGGLLRDFLARHVIYAMEKALSKLSMMSDVLEKFMAHAHGFLQRYYEQAIQVSAKTKERFAINPILVKGVTGYDLWLMQLLVTRVLHNPNFTHQEFSQIKPIMRLLARQDCAVCRAVRKKILIQTVLLSQ